MTGSGDESGNDLARGEGRGQGLGRNAPGSADLERKPDLERKRRLGGFLNHLIAYFAVMIIVTPINAALDPHYPWFLFPLIGWAAPLALHVAYVMGWWGRKLPADRTDGRDRNG